MRKHARKHAKDAAARVTALAAALAALLTAIGPAAATKPDPEPTAAETFGEGLVVVRAGRVITVSGDELARADIVIEDGEITLVGVGIDVPSAARVIDARDQTVMPGMIALGTRVGLPGYTRRGVNAQRTVGDELYWDLIDTEPFLRAGFTAAAFEPDGDGLPGTAGLYRLAAPEPVRPIDRRAYLVARLDSLPRDKRTLRGALERARAELKKVEEARTEWEKQQKAGESNGQTPEGPEGPEGDQPSDDSVVPGGPATPDEPSPAPATEPEDESKDASTFTPPPIDPAHKPIADLLNGVANAPALLIRVTSPAGFLHARDALATEPGIRPDFAFARLSGEMAFALDKIAGVDTTSEGDESDQPTRVILPADLTTMPAAAAVLFNPAAELERRGVELTFRPLSDANATIANFRTALADMVRYGLGREHALAGVTLHPAKLVGADDRLGSIQKGRRADLVFYDRDPLDPAARVTRVMIEGETVWETDR